jgi:hypothetical protein
LTCSIQIYLIFSIVEKKKSGEFFAAKIVNTLLSRENSFLRNFCFVLLKSVQAAKNRQKFRKLQILTI